MIVETIDRVWISMGTLTIKNTLEYFRYFFPIILYFVITIRSKPRLLIYSKQKTIAFYVEQKVIRCKLNDFALKWDYIDGQTTLMMTFPLGCTFSKYQKASAVLLNG